MKISIFSFAVNDKFPIDIMHRQFKKHMKEDFDFILFNDAIEVQMEHNINAITEYNKIKCVRVPQNIHIIQNPSEGYAATLNWAVHNYAVQNNCETIILMHTDVFPICDVNVSNIMSDKTVVGPTEARIIDGENVTYFYPALTFVNMKLLKNPSDLDFGLAPGLDTGGKTNQFIKSNPTAVKFIFNHQIFNLLDSFDELMSKYLKADLKICREHGLSAGWVAEGFYHYMAGSQWNADNPKFAAGHKMRMDLFLNYFY